MNDTTTTPQPPSLTTARSQPQTLEKSTADKPVVIEPKASDVRDLPASLVNTNEEQVLSPYPPSAAPADEMNRLDINTVADFVSRVHKDCDALNKDIAELKDKLARHFPALF